MITILKFFNEDSATLHFGETVYSLGFDMTLDFTVNDFLDEGVMKQKITNNLDIAAYFVINENTFNSDGSSTINLTTSDGINVTFDFSDQHTFNNETDAWWMWAIFLIIKYLCEDDFDSNCNQRIKNAHIICPNGVDKVNIIEGGWFQKDSCSLKCK